MGLDLNDFNIQPRNTIEDFKSEVPRDVALSDKQAAKFAAQQTMLEGGDLGTYQDTKAQLTDPKFRQEFLARQQAVRDTIWKDAKSTLLSTIADPNVDTNTKMQLWHGAQTIADSYQLDTNKVLEEQAAVADGEPDETGKTAEARALHIDVVDTGNRYRKDMVKRYNDIASAENQSTLDQFGDVAELMVPFAEWIDSSQKLDEAVKTLGVDSKQAILMGNKKQQLIDILQSYPLEQRAQVVDTLVGIIENNDNIILPDGNSLEKMDALRHMMLDGDYSNTDRWIDNVTSVLDAAFGVGAWVRAGAKFTKEAKAVRGAGQVATGAEGIAEEARAFQTAKQAAQPSALEKEAQAFKPEQPATDTALQQEAQTFKSDPLPMDPKLQEEADNFTKSKADTLENDPLAREAAQWSSRTKTDPTSPSQVVKDANPRIARDMHGMAEGDETGEAAKALYGTTRDDALAKDILPEPAQIDGSIPHKVNLDAGEPTALKIARASGNIAGTDATIAQVTARLNNAFKELEGLTLSKEGVTIGMADDGSLAVKARYSSPDSGFLTPEDAINTAKFGLRDYSVDENAFEVFGKANGKWEKVDTKKADPSKYTEYSVGIDYNYRIKPEDLEMSDIMTKSPGLVAQAVKLADRAPSQSAASLGQGSLVQHILDPASLLPKEVVGAISVAADKAVGIRKALLEEFKGFVKDFEKMPKARRAAIKDYIQEANADGIALNTADLYQRGFNQKEVAALRKWRKATDAMWHVANYDMRKNLVNRGFKVFTHNDGETKLVGRTVSKQTAKNEVKTAYDPVDNTVSGVDIDELYDNGGEIFRLAEPIEIDGKMVGEVISRNSTETGYTRAFYDGEAVLRYREGYYPVMYDANFFIRKRMKGNDGKMYTKALGAARTRKDAKQLMEQMRINENISPEEFSKTYFMDKDRKAETGSIFDDNSYGVASNSGLSMQKLRGERLASVEGGLEGLGHSHLKDPLDAVSQQVNALSSRVSMRDTMETLKRQWMQTYGDFVDLKVDPNTGQKVFPASPRDIRGAAPVSDYNKVLGDARTMYNYIYGIENGYVSAFDSVFSSVTNWAAGMLGEVGFSKAEAAALDLAKRSPSNAAKSAMFNLTIAASAPRQALIQRAQILYMAPYNPTYFAKDWARDWVGINLVRAGVSKNPKYVKLHKEIVDAGVLESVDAHTFVRDRGLRLADDTAFRKARSLAGKPLEWSRIAGFDWAEQDILMASYLAARDKYVKGGKAVKTIRDREKILAEGRALSLQMNKAGEMPYTHNSLSIPMQFFSFQHKAILQPFTNQNLTVGQKVGLLAFSTVVWGVDATLVGAALNSFWGDDAPSEQKDVIRDGLLDITLNKALTELSGKDQMIDWGATAPFEAYGFGNVFVSLIGNDLGTILAESPAGSLVASNGRVREALATGLRYFNVNDYQDPVLQTTFPEVVQAAAGMFSGFSSSFKGAYAYHTGQAMSSFGNITDKDVTKVEAVLQGLFGLRTKEQEGMRKAKEEFYGKYEATDDDVQQWYTELKRSLVRKGMTVEQQKVQQAILGEAWRVFGEDRDRVNSQVLKLITNDAKKGDYTFINNVLRQMGHKTESELWGSINQLPKGSTRDTLTTMMKQYYGEDNG